MEQHVHANNRQYRLMPIMYQDKPARRLVFVPNKEIEQFDTQNHHSSRSKTKDRSERIIDILSKEKGFGTNQSLFLFEPLMGLEPTTYALRMRCSTN